MWVESLPALRSRSSADRAYRMVSQPAGGFDLPRRHGFHREPPAKGPGHHVGGSRDAGLSTIPESRLESARGLRQSGQGGGMCRFRGSLPRHLISQGSCRSCSRPQPRAVRPAVGNTCQRGSRPSLAGRCCGICQLEIYTHDDLGDLNGFLHVSLGASTREPGIDCPIFKEVVPQA